MIRYLLVFVMFSLPVWAQGQGKEVLHGSHHVEPRFDPLVVPDLMTAFDDGPFVLPEFDPKLAEQSAFALENAEAQKWFRQGMALFYYGEHWEAQRCFRMVVTIAPDSAMGFFGLALANEMVPGCAAMFIRKAAELGGGDGVGGRLIAAYERYYSDLRGNREAAATRLLRDLEKLALEFPDEVEVRALVVRLLARPDVESPLPLEALIAQVLARCPQHPVAGCRAEIWQKFDRERASLALKKLVEGGPEVSIATWDRAMRFKLAIGRFDLAAGCLSARAGAEEMRMSIDRRRAEVVPRTDLRDVLRFAQNSLIDPHEARAQQIVDLYRQGKKLEAFKQFDSDFRYSCGWLEPRCINELNKIAAEMKLPQRWTLRATSGLGAQAGGALISWPAIPVQQAPDWILSNDDTLVNSNEFAGKVRVFVFFRGAACDHCMGQLEGFALNAGAFSKAGIPVVAISTDEVGKLSKTRTKAGNKFPFPIVSDAELNLFRAYMAYDQFSQRALHATVVVDPKGQVFWRKVGGQPFHDVGEVLDQARAAAGKN